MSFKPAMSSCGCDCAKQLVSGYLSQNGSLIKPSETAVLYQTSLMSALVAGVYGDGKPLRDVFTHGNFGLGTFNRLDGELIAFGDEAYQLGSDGSASKVNLDQQSPFAVVTRFDPCAKLDIHLKEPASLDKIIDEIVPSQNHFCTIRIDGEFELVRTRTVARQTFPYKPLLQVVAEQAVFDFEGVSGTMIGFRSPPYVQGVNVAGYHIHFITEERNGGGHVLEYRLKKGKLQLGVVSKLFIDLPDSSSFNSADLNPADLDATIRSSE